MPIQPPTLDDRSYADLVEELLERIPAHTPEYSHPREGDPGRTLLELFAWLADTLLYRINVVPERQRLVFLKLLGLPMRGAVPAQGMVSLVLADGLTEPQELLEGARLKGPVAFETRTPLRILPVTGQVFHKRRMTPTEATEAEGILPQLAELYRVSERGGEVEGYVTTPLFSDATAVAEGIDLVAASIDATLWIALLASEPTEVENARTTLGAHVDGSAQRIHIGVMPTLQSADPFRSDVVAEVSGRAPKPVVWEIATGRSRAGGDPVYLELEVLEDGTAGLTRGGVVQLTLPSRDDVDLPPNDPAIDVDAGIGDRPPRVDDPDLAERLVTWIRLRPTERLASLEVSWVGINAVQIDQRSSFPPTVLGRSDGTADQQMSLPATSVDAEGLRIEVEEVGRGYQSWRRVEALAASGRDDAVYVLDPEAGVVSFGDGVRGRVPPDSLRVRAVDLRAGGGVAGNLPPRALEGLTEGLDASRAPVTRKVEVVQALATTGGADAETLEQAERRIPAELRHRNRAITASDYRVLAQTTPGTRIGRVEILPGFKPHQRRFEVPGVVSAMVLPRKDEPLPPNPRPDRPTIGAVHAWLGDRVSVTTELYVIGCDYVPVAVAVGIEVRDGFGRDETVRQVTMTLRHFLWPLPPGGPGDPGEGWPLGRAVRDREIEVVVARVPGVDEVIGVRLFERAEDGETWSALDPKPDQVVQIPMLAYQLPELLGVSVVVDAPPATSMQGAPNPFASAGGIAVPVVPEVC